MVKVEGQELTIPADQIREVQTTQTGKPAVKDDSETWGKRFDADVAQKKLAWDVTFSLGSSGAELEDSCLAAPIAGVEVLKEPEFKLVERESDDE